MCGFRVAKEKGLRAPFTKICGQKYLDANQVRDLCEALEPSMSMLCTAMCDAIQIAHPQIASDAKKCFFFFASDAKTHPLDLKSLENARTKKTGENPAMLGQACDAKNRGVFLRSSDAKCLRFGLSLRFGLRCERPRCQIASDAGRAMRTTKVGTDDHIRIALQPDRPILIKQYLKPPLCCSLNPLVRRSFI